MNFENEQIPFPLLIGDIGGTNARFQILVDPDTKPIGFPNLLTANHSTIEHAIQTGILDHTDVKPRAAVIAAAGPIENGRLDLTNYNWSIHPKKFLRDLSIDDLTLLNDFEAQALATTSFEPENIEKIGVGEPVANANRVIVGPGTGLGAAGLIHSQDCWIPVPGEGGHVSMGPQTDEDFSIWPFLERENNRVSAEHLVSGRGILNIYKAVSAREGRDGKFTTPEQITTAALIGADQLAVSSVELFCGYLGRVAGDMALTFLARGGVYIAGGIGKQITSIMRNSRFRHEFENKFPHSELLKSIPTYLIVHENAALSGLASFVRSQNEFGIDTKGRRWRL
jgi:glucokinase